MNVGKAVKWIREQRGYSPKEFCDKLGMLSGQLWRLENTNDNVRIRQLERVADVLKVDVAILYYLTLMHQGTGTKLMELAVDITPHLQYHLKKHYNLELNETVGI